MRFTINKNKFLFFVLLGSFFIPANNLDAKRKLIKRVIDGCAHESGFHRILYDKEFRFLEPINDYELYAVQKNHEVVKVKFNALTQKILPLQKVDFLVPVRSLSVSTDGAIWAIEKTKKKDNVCELSADGLVKKRSGVYLDQVCVGNRSNVYGLGRDKFVYKWDNRSKWIRTASKKLKSMAVLINNNVPTLYGINLRGEPEKKVGEGPWNLMGGNGFHKIMAKGGHIWGVKWRVFLKTLGAAPVLHKWTGSKWKAIKGYKVACIGGGLMNFALAPNGKLWCTDNDVLNPFRRDWERMHGASHVIAVGDANNIWHIGRWRRVYRWNKSSRKWGGVGGKLKYIAAGGSEVWGLDGRGRPVRYEIVKGGKKGWKGKGGSFSRISVGGPNLVCGIGRKGVPYKWDGTKRKWNKITGKGFPRKGFIEISISERGQIWAIARNKVVYKWRGGRWTGIKSGVVKISAVGNEELWIINTKSEVEHLDNRGQWKRAALGKFRNIYVGRGGVWATDGRGRIFRKI
jgi:hypothetical protein